MDSASPPGTGAEDATHVGDPSLSSSPAEPISIAPGGTIGRYVVLAPLGRGAMGVVVSAWDPELDRKVAIKLLGHGGHGTDRLLREAQALARVAHPNVVSVFDVGTVDGQVFVAMEFVAGTTLSRWSAAARRPWRERLRALLDAARGLSAVHDAGLVHRDVKPDNVMIDERGRVRLMDLGLAAPSAATAADPNVPGALAGTPAYMAPEQFAGRIGDARSDQFAWCVMAWELLHGERPFAGDSVPALALAVTQGRIASAPAGSGIPRWLGRVVERGLALDPGQRWSDVHALIDAAQADPGRRWRRLSAAATVIAALAGVASIPTLREGMHERTCRAQAAALITAWSGDRRETIRAAMLATKAPFAERTADFVLGSLDGWVAELERVGHEACLARPEAGAQWERTQACLEDRRTTLEAHLDMWTAADAVALRGAEQAVAELPAPERCRDPAALAGSSVAPERIRDEVGALSRRLAQVRAEHAAGRYEDARVQAAELTRDAEALGWIPLVARVRLSAGIIGEAAGHHDAARAELEAAFFDALRADEAEVGARAAVALLEAVAHAGSDWAAATRWGEVARALLDRLGGGPALLEADLRQNLAQLAAERGEFEQALALQEEARTLLVDVLGPGHPRLADGLDQMGNTLASMGRYADAIERHRRGLELREAALGPAHPNVATSLNNLGAVQLQMGAAEDALVSHRRALEIKQSSLGADHPDVASSKNNVGTVYLATGRYEQALAWLVPALTESRTALPANHPELATMHGNLGAAYQGLGRLPEAREEFLLALSIQEAARGPEHGLVADALNNVGAVQHLLGDAAAARSAHERALEIRQRKLGPGHPNVAMSHLNLAAAERTLGHPELALVHASAALDVWTATLGPDHPYLGAAWLERAENELVLGRADEAIEHATRAVEVCSGAAAPREWLASAQFLLARTLQAAGRERARARELASTARDGFSAAGAGSAKDLADVERWLAAR